ncbi:MAG: M14/M99 family metallopeptidase [Pseudomonadota bacterium]
MDSRGKGRAMGVLAGTCLVLVMWMLVWTGDLAAQKTHTVFYEDTENELHVYRVYGTKPGKTLLLIGGIQGDEPGGFLAADLYADMSLETGNLIVVPRANFPSIMKQQRQINEDMNRKFADDKGETYEAKVVEVLKQLILESDCLLNLHEGSGFYRDTWESDMKNPNRFGQSIIADTHLFEDASKKIRIDLKGMAETVISKINTHIDNPDNYFHFNNHRTRQADSIHKEQRKSATYFALYTGNIPAFGIESSQDLPLEAKIRQHIYAINGFMELFKIVPETPGLDLETPKLQYMVISVNDSLPVVVENGRTLRINPNDKIEVQDIKANYLRGLSVDILGVGSTYNDMRKPHPIEIATRIIARKDFYPCGEVYLDMGSGFGVPAVQVAATKPGSPAGIVYSVKINGVMHEFRDNAHIELKRGDRMEIVDVRGRGIDPLQCVVNFKGFVGNIDNNTGEDRGYEIDTGRNVLMDRFSIDKKGLKYYIVTTFRDEEISRLYVDMKP